jgi:S1-C subfamily serine protease/uncharacterized membrane protein YfcA
MISRILLIVLLNVLCQDILSAYPATPLEQLQINVNQATAHVMQSVVSVKAQKQSQTGILYESIGSGFIVDEKGYVLTNLHVVENAQNITASQWRIGPNDISATLVNTDESLDLALLKIESNDLFKPAPLDNSDQLKVGNLVICVGSPFGFKHSVTFGIVSDLHREIVIQGLTYKDMIQTDAVINEGNSGGPIVNIFGRVIGVGTAIYAPDGTYTGIGFGIPINRAKHFFSQTTGAVLAAATAPLPAANPKEPIDITTKIPDDQIHRQFSDCRECHVISAKSVVTVQATLPHLPLEGCSDCHILTNDKVATAPITVAMNVPKQIPSFLQFGFFVRSAILILFGLVVGTVGTMVGVGGGFIHVPFLMLVCGFSVQDAIGTSIGIIFFNTTAGSFMYYHQKCIDIDLAKKLSLIVIPGAILGPLIVQQYNSSWFLIAFTLLLFTISCYLFFTNSQINVLPEYRYNRCVTIEDIDGNKISYSTNIGLSYIGTFIIGFFSNLIGIGGGIIHVPFLILFLRIPVHIALGTSHFILCVSSFAGMIMFGILGNIHFDYMMPVAVGAILGAKIGVELSKLTSPVVIRKMLALILFFITFRIFIRQITTIMMI